MLHKIMAGVRHVLNYPGIHHDCPMLVREFIRVALFVGAVAAVYFTAACIILGGGLQRLRGKARPLTRFQIRLRRTILGLAALGSVCIAYGYFVEPYWLEVTHVRITSPKLHEGTRAIRIVHISDLHCNTKPRLEERLPGVIASEKPDLIVFTGDSINSLEGLPVFKRCMRRLAALAPVFAVRGNWDVGKWKVVDLFGGTGVRELDGQCAKVEVRGGPEVWVAGIPMEGQERMEAALRKVPPGHFTILLYHSPSLLGQVPRDRVDLFCAGHTHGGQVALPFYGALLTYSSYGKQYEAGLYHLTPMWLYVNRGIGMTGWVAPPVRFCARPEVTVIDVLPAR